MITPASTRAFRSHVAQEYRTPKLEELQALLQSPFHSCEKRDRRKASVMIWGQSHRELEGAMSHAAHGPCHQASPFSFSGPSSWGRSVWSCLTLSGTSTWYGWGIWHRSCPDSWLGVVKRVTSMWSQGCHTPALRAEQGKEKAG